MIQRAGTTVKRWSKHLFDLRNSIEKLRQVQLFESVC